MRRIILTPDLFTPEFRRRFWSRIIKQDGCWLWTGATFRKGYGNVHIRAIGNIGAHIIAYVISTGKVLDQQDYVLHSCDNPPCCNSAHLWVGSQQENIQDAIAKNRFVFNIKFAQSKQLKGRLHSNTHLTDNDVLAIRHARAEGYSQRYLASLYGVCYQAIQSIEHYRTWKHI